MTRRRTRYVQRKRSRKRKNRQLNFRTGKFNAAGAKKISPNSRTIKSITSNNFTSLAVSNPDEVAGCNMAFSITNWSKPATPTTTEFTTEGTVLKPVPHNHVEILSDGYDSVQVLSAYYRFNVRYTATDSGAKDWIFAFKFGTVSTAADSLKIGAEAIDAWKSQRQSYGWVYHRMSSTHSGGAQYPSTKTIGIKIPNVGKLVRKLHVVHTEIGSDDLSHAITAGADASAVLAFLHIMVLNIDGVEMATDDIRIDLDVYQTVRVRKLQAQAELIQEVVTET